LSGRHLSGDLISIPDCGLRGLGIAACPGEAVPLMRLNIIARDTLAIVIHKTEIDLRSGGILSFTMRSPEGKDFPNTGCILEVVPQERLVWTDALLPGYRPSQKPFFSAVIALEKQGKGTRYTATAIHRDEAGRKQHEEMGFYEGWGQCLDQLVAYSKTM
jgi:uncharacterized protein YndB with AHSA1/START domain